MRALIAALVLVPTVAAAQSTRYPPPEPDADEEADAYSEFWENAIEPGREVYDDLVARASKLIGRRSDEARGQAIDLLDQATALLPDHADAWAWLGLAHEAGEAYADCRDALERAWAIDPTWAAAPRPLGLALGDCRARAGDFDGATEVLERLVAHGDVRVETLWRLGEVDIATGRLDDAQTVLGLALDQSPADQQYANAAWALAVAADRARDPEATQAAAEIALRMDPERVRVSDPPGGFLPASEEAYYLGVAAETAGLPELALLEFRHYVNDEVEGTWVARAREHVKASKDLAIADRVDQVGTEKVDLAKAATVIAKVEPQLRACLKATPELLVQLHVTILGPPLPPLHTLVGQPPPPPRRVSNLPTAGAHAASIASYETDPTAVQAAVACVDKVAGALALPAPKTPGTWVTLSAPVIWR